MAKREKKSLASLIGNREIEPTEIDQAASKVHQKAEKETTKPVAKEKKVRVSVDTPVSLYMKSKQAGLEEGISSLKDFYLHCVTEYLKGKGKL